MQGMRYVGMDVHAETIAIAVVDEDGTERDLGTVANRPEAIRRCMKKLRRPEALRCFYEAGPTGYVLYWQLTQMGIECTVVAPTLIPTKAGDRVKTDRRDARKLARYLRSGDLTAVWVPDEAHEALRDLVRARQAAKIDEKRARNRLQKFLLRHGQRPPRGVKAWTARHRAWLEGLKLEQATLQVVLGEYLHEVIHGEQRVARLAAATSAWWPEGRPSKRSSLPSPASSSRSCGPLALRSRGKSRQIELLRSWAAGARE